MNSKELDYNSHCTLLGWLVTMRCIWPFNFLTKINSEVVGLAGREVRGRNRGGRGGGGLLNGN